MQTGLGNDDGPVGMASPRRMQYAKHRVLQRIGDLHDDQQEVRLALAPGNIFLRIVVCLSETARIEEPEHRRLERHIVECRGPRAGGKSLTDLRPRVTGQRGHVARSVGSSGRFSDHGRPTRQILPSSCRGDGEKLDAALGDRRRQLP